MKSQRVDAMFEDYDALDLPATLLSAASSRGEAIFALGICPNFWLSG